MSLTKYKAKRSFEKTPEPKGGKAESKTLRFVVQKHAASHLHYDFRLEMEGVLKSWAVPKGPSMDTKIKRLAMMVEDHPYAYRTFEGTIPKGNYGAGTVMVWDEGDYEATDLAGKSKTMQDKELRHQLHTGKIKFTLHGKKLKGAFALVKAASRGENSWLLMKLDDDQAISEDILLKDKSVISGKAIENLNEALSDKKTKGKITAKKSKQSLTLSTASRKATQKKKIRQKTEGEELTSLQTKGVKKTIPSTVSPMLATLVDKPFDEAGWIYEVKWDGYRAMTTMNEGEVELKSRNDKSFNEKFYPVTDALKNWGINAVVDGEIVVINKKGASDFGALQNWRSEADGLLAYYVFDILWLNGKDVTTLPLTERKEILRTLVPKEGIIRLSDNFAITGTSFFNLARQMNLEGIIAKKANSTYQAGMRTRDWLKIKTNKRQEVVIGGFTKNDDTSKLFSALLVGVYDKAKLIYTGKIGTGFTDKLQKEMMTMFEPLITKQIPFETLPDINKPSRFRPNPPHATATWLKPELVGEVSYTEMTSDGIMRHPSFEGMRTDKKAKDVVLESEIATDVVVDLVNESHAIIKPFENTDRKTLLNPKEETQVREINGHSLKFTNLSKLYWPEEKITKRDLLNYYYQVAPIILPYLKDRPQSLNRFPNGIHEKSFYQKDVTGKVPDWVQTYQYRSSDEDKDKHFMVASDEASVLYMASLGCIELNPWSSTIHKPDHPDWCIIDLDPDKNTFDQVIEAALMTKKILDEMGISSYCKTSGSTGLHIYIPLGAKYTYEQSKEFARDVVKKVHNEIPEFTSIERAVAARKGKMYLDFLQNRPQATLAAPYSLRPKPGATVSMPLNWEEVKKGLKIKDFTIRNALARIKEVGDIFKPVLGKGVTL
jgi:bifunctional non-homologous end joining protein LigD